MSRKPVLALAVGTFYFVDDRGATTGLAALRVPAGFTVERVAGSDMVSYPMMGTVDERGRLFLCESSGNTLNNTQMAANPDYRIRVLEDRNHDGVYDHSQVFADKLTLPAGDVASRRTMMLLSAVITDSLPDLVVSISSEP